MATTQRNANAAVVLLFLYRLVDVLASYFKEVRRRCRPRAAHRGLRARSPPPPRRAVS